MNYKQAKEELTKRGFKYSHTGMDREYWVRTDGQPEIFLDHSATLSCLGIQYHISDFVNRKSQLQQMIELWEGISDLHHQAIFEKPDGQDHHVFSPDHREQLLLHARANIVAASIKAYKEMLEG